MIAVETLLDKLRRTLKDEDKNSFSDDELMDYIDAGISFVRRIIISENPEYIARIITMGTLEPEMNRLELPTACYVFDVRINGKKIPRDNLSSIKDTEEKGEIKKYVLLGGRRIMFFPTPERECDFMVAGVYDQPRLSLSGNTPYNSDIDNLIFEYVILRAGMGDQFQMSQETQLMQVIVQQVERLLNIYNECEQGQVQGYY